MATLREIGQGLIDPKYCCVAVPLVNFGIYAIIGEQLIVGLAAGLMSFTTPKVVGTYFPTFATVIFAICCLIVAALQPVGFIGVLREKTKTFRIYSWLNLVAIACAFITSAVLIAVSGVNHNRAVSSCISNFFAPSADDTASATQMLSQQGPLICTPFAWADLGLMAGLWTLALIVQGYFIYITKTYSRSQVSDHKLYHSVYSENPEAFTMSILQSKRYNPGSVYSAGGAGAGAAGLPPRVSTYAQRDREAEGAWDARASVEDLKREDADGYGYDQGYAPGGVGYAQGQGQGQGYGNQAYGYGAHPGMNAGPAGPAGQSSGYGSGPGGEHGQYDDAPRYAAHGHGQYDQDYGYQQHQHHQMPEPAAYGRDPGPTPTMNRFNSGDGVGYAGDGGLSRPDHVQNHPAEGMFGRKSPRG